MRFLSSIRNGMAGREQFYAYTIIALVVLALASVTILSGDRVRSLDEPNFLAIAENLALNGIYAHQDGELTAYHAPGLVLFITPFVKLGAGLMELRLINNLLLGASLLLVFHMVRRNAGPLAGLMAVILIPLWPVILYASLTLYPQTLAAFMLVLTAFLLDRLTVTQSKVTAALAGLSFGFLILTIPIVLLLVPIFVLWVWFQSHKPLPHLIAFLACAALLVAGWGIRNHNAFGVVILTATSGGYNLLAGNSPDARYNTSLDVKFPDYVYTEITGKTEIERDRIFKRAAFREMANNPARTVSLYFGKFLHWFDFSNRLMSDTAVEGGASTVNVSTREVILLAAYSLIILPLVARVALLRKHPFRPIETLGLCLWIGAGLAYAVFFTRVRFRMPFDWLIIANNAIFIALIFETSIERWKSDIKTVDY